MISAIKTRIETAQFDETVEFYKDLIGLRVVSEFEETQGVILSVSNKRSEGFLEIAHSETPKTASEISLQFRTPNIAKFLKNVFGKIEYKGPHYKPWGSKYVYMQDPNGIKIIVFEGEV